MSVVETTRPLTTSTGELPAGVVGTVVHWNEQRDADGVLRALVQVNREFVSLPQDALRLVEMADRERKITGDPS